MPEFLAVLTVGGIFGIVGYFFGWQSIGTIAAIACSTVFIVRAIEKGRGGDKK